MRQPNPTFTTEPLNEIGEERLVVFKGNIILEEGSTIQSPNYVAGTTGWIIRGDGTSEFN